MWRIRHVFVGDLRADDGADRFCHGLNPMPSGPHRDIGNVIMPIKQDRSRFPFPLLGVDFENDSAFTNTLVVSWCRGEVLEVMRSRAC